MVAVVVMLSTHEIDQLPIKGPAASRSRALRSIVVLILNAELERRTDLLWRLVRLLHLVHHHHHLLLLRTGIVALLLASCCLRVVWCVNFGSDHHLGLSTSHRRGISLSHHRFIWSWKWRIRNLTLLLYIRTVLRRRGLCDLMEVPKRLLLLFESFLLAVQWISLLMRH